MVPQRVLQRYPEPSRVGEAPTLGHCACGGGCPRCREASDAGLPALAINEPGDEYEREAERLTDWVMGSADVGGAAPVRDLTQDLTVRRSASFPAAPALAPAIVHGVLRTPGEPLDHPTREFMESRFGQSFTDVRVHADQGASASARAVQAEAYTVGSHIVFAEHGYSPGSLGGRRLLAHELAHVTQQRSNGGAVAAAPSIAGPSRAPAERLYPYRSKGKDTIAFGMGDEPTLKEEEFHDAKKQPWIESILISFDAVGPDTGHAAAASAAGEPPPRLPKGTLTAKYHKAVLPDITIAIVGGSTMATIGLTDRVKDATVKRLEGLGYTDSQNIQLGNLTDPVAKKGKGARYSQSGAGTMNYAIFFKGIQAIHQGALDTGSHACVHVGAEDSIRQLNYHSVIGKTKVTVTYAQSVLDDLCCHRRASGNPHWDRNPCNEVKSSSCSP